MAESEDHLWSADHSLKNAALDVSVLAFGTRVRGFKPVRSRRIFRAKNPQHPFLRRGSKAVGPMS